MSFRDNPMTAVRFVGALVAARGDPELLQAAVDQHVSRLPVEEALEVLADSCGRLAGMLEAVQRAHPAGRMEVGVMLARWGSVRKRSRYERGRKR